MTAEQFFAGVAIFCGLGLALLIWWDRPRKRPPIVKPHVPANRWPPKETT